MVKKKKGKKREYKYHLVCNLCGKKIHTTKRGLKIHVTHCKKNNKRKEDVIPLFNEDVELDLERITIIREGSNVKIYPESRLLLDCSLREIVKLGREIISLVHFKD